VGVGGHVSGHGLVNLSVVVSQHLAGITVLASRGREHRRLHVNRVSAYSFTVVGTLPPGRWTVTIRYGTPRAYGADPSSQLHVTVRRPL
jgi:negative regulator of sigma E activity